MSPIDLLPGAVSELFVQATVTGQLTLADRYGLQAAVLDDSLAEEERVCLDRLFHAVRRGRIQVVDELSVVL